MTRQPVPDRRTPARWWIPAILLGGLALRLIISPFGAHPGDFPVITGWAAATRVHGLLNIYAGSDANYPPLGMLIIGAAGLLYGRLSYGALPIPGDLLWTALAKLPAIMADAVLLGIVSRSRAFREGDGNAPWIILMVIAFNPALILMSAWWGQLDSVYAMFAALAALAAGSRKAFPAGLLIGLGAMVKLQALFLLPILCLWLLCLDKRPHAWLRQLARIGAGLAIPIIFALGPYAASGQVSLVLGRLVALVASPGWLTVNALNVWYLGTGGAGSWQFSTPLTLPDTTIVAWGLSARRLGVLLLAAWSLGILAGISRRNPDDRARWLAASALLAMGMFLFPTQSHERYLLPAVPLLALSIGADGTEVRWQAVAAFVIISVLHALNLAWAAPVVAELEGRLSGNLMIGLTVAGLHMLSAIWLLGWIWQEDGSNARKDQAGNSAVAGG